MASLDLKDAPSRPWWRSMTGVCLAAVFAAVAVSAPGCGGCSRNPQAQKKAAEEERKKEAEDLEKKKPPPPFDFGNLVVEPWDDTSGAAAVKPGHWTATSQLMKANNEDFHGELDLSLMDSGGRPLFVDRTRFLMTMSRPVALSKGRAKRIETTMFVPTQSGNVQVRSTLRRRGSGAAVQPDYAACTPMPSYQYHFVVLAKDPKRYAYIKTLYSVRFPFDNEFDSGEERHYRVVAPETKEGLALPSNPLAWTSIAYVLWDEMSPDTLSPEQQQALVDWMHWGGQLIVSGPGSIDLLRKSFLEPYLPAEGGELKQLDDEDVAELNETWTLADQPRNITPLVLTAPWSGVELEPRPNAATVPGTGGLLVERRVGRGRLVVSAFQLDERDLLNWRGNFDNFFNACLLRRPPRRWSNQTGTQFDTLDWAGELATHRRDARLTSKLRFFSRDTGTETNWERTARTTGYGGFGGGYGSGQVEEVWNPSETLGGVGGWNDFSNASNAARAVLREAAGVQVPRGSFVIAVLAAYLVVLVPLNYLVFYTVGRLEWAWVAAPVIAAIGTVVVVWQAQLDIGFVRSQTEIGVLELQGDHPRGHLTRYTAVYTSLGTSYDMKFDDPTALVAPFASDANFELLAGQDRDEVVYRKHDDVRLTDLGVTSSTTSMIHSEQMFDLGGAIRLGKSSSGLDQVENMSEYDLASVAVLQRTERGLRGCWIGDMRSRSSAILAFTDLDPATLNGGAFFEDRKAASAAEARPLDMGRLIGLGQYVGTKEDGGMSTEEMFPVGEIRLVGRIDEVLPGLSIEPEASQIRGAVLVLAHLQHPQFAPPVGDVNSKPHMPAKSTLDLELEQGGGPFEEGSEPFVE